VCGGVHSHASAYAIEQAMGLQPPPLGTVIRNLGEAAEMGYDNPLHLYLLAGPDYSEQVVSQVNPGLWQKAQDWKCPGRETHGFDTMAELMSGLNPLTGKLYQEGLEFTRLAREQFSLLHGKYPHPQTIVPGGVSTTFTLETLNEFHSRMSQAFDYAKRMIAVWDDICEFFYDADERYAQVGQRPLSSIDPGFWDDPYAYDATYVNCNEWGIRRPSTPGAVVDGELVTTRLTDLNIGWEEFVERSFYEDGATNRHATDPLGNPLSPYHSWNKQTRPKPAGKDWRDKYTWACTPRWDRNVVEAGAYTRLLNTALARQHPPSRFYEATGHSLEMEIPKGREAEERVEWPVPQQWNARERHRGRADHNHSAQRVAMENVLEAYRLLKHGEERVAATDPEGLEKAIPTDNRISMGWWGAGRGWLTHHMEIDGGKLVNYQICTPSTINASPRDPWDQPGPYEEAVMNTPIIEDTTDPSRFTAIDMLRTIRSFDPCMPCTTHVDTGAGKLRRDVNTCACGTEHE
jgi:hydrogenase large subunit